MNVPLSQPDITQLEIDAVLSVLKSSQLSLGPKLEDFEHRVSSYIGVPFGIAVSSGTAGLHLCMEAMHIGPGDEVIVPSFTFIAAANVVRYVGATPVFVDIEKDSLNLDPSLIEPAITPRTRAIVVVHTFGRTADMGPVLDIARRHRLMVIEDACEAIGAAYRDRKAGSLGHAAVFAFYPNKQITTGEGGMIVTRDEQLARTTRAMRNHGRYPSDAWHQHSVLGYNYRLPEMSCALGCAQMARLDEILAKREAAARTYSELLADIPAITAPAITHGVSWFVYVVRVPPARDAALRDSIVDLLAKDGIQCGRYFAPIHQQPAYAGCELTQPLAVTEAESLRTIALPFFSNITREQIYYVVDRLKLALARSHQHRE